ncbi:MAG: efflux RND transporter periplasmic adaptor subunit [bacterium]|nr:efflux RND transporter periplasmic adaptor subunit [bacterium]
MAKQGTLVETVSGSGRVQSELGVKVSAQVAGKIIRLHAKEGDRVTRGQFLAQLDRETYQAQVDRATSNLSSAKANYAKTIADVKRLRELASKQLVSASELEAAEATLLQTTSAVEQGAAALKEVNDMMSKTTISAPVDGVITDVRKKEGELTLGAQFQEDVILVISDLGKMTVECDIDENDVVKISIGDSARVLVDAFPDSIIIGHVTEIAHTAKVSGFGTQDQVTNFLVKIRLDNTLPQLRPGMSATVDIVTEVVDDAVMVPIQSITVRQESLEKTEIEMPSDVSSQAQKRLSDRLKREKLPEVVFRYEKGKAKKVPVLTGIASNLDIQVRSGVSIGDTIVTGPYRMVSRDLKENDQVKLEDPKKKEEERKKRMKERK